MELNGIAVLVTGAAGGLGLATAKHLSAKGARLIMLDLVKEKLDVEAKELKALAYDIDVTNTWAIEQTFASLREQDLIPRVCINCAGIVLAQKMFSSRGDMTPEVFKKVIDINLGGTYSIMYYAAKHMKDLEPINADNEKGLIINTASIAAFEGQIGQVAYSASKGGVASIALPESAKESLIATTHFPKRLGKPEEFAKFCEQIIENPLLNGATIRLDGAVRLAAK